MKKHTYNSYAFRDLGHIILGEFFMTKRFRLVIVILSILLIMGLSACTRNPAVGLSETGVLTVEFNKCDSMKHAINIALGDNNPNDVKVVKIIGNAAMIMGSNWYALRQIYDTEYSLNVLTLDLSEMSNLWVIGYINVPYFTELDSDRLAKKYHISNMYSIISLPESLINIGDETFKYEWNIYKLVIPDGVVNIGDSAFECAEEGYSVLKYIEIPESVTNIGAKAFKACVNLESITIPENVIEVKRETFYGCESLTAIYCKRQIAPTLGKDAFSYISQDAVLYIPEGAVGYDAPGWPKNQQLLLADGANAI